MTKHTKGPWTVEEINDKTDILITSRRVHIAQIVKYGMVQAKNHPADLANARLIAAAPDLLEACEMAVERLIIANCEDEEFEFIKRLEIAIAKAEGR